jgi:hypothetical protein
MNRRIVNNALVGLAGVLAATNAEADQEVADLQVEVQQLRAALEQHRAVVKEAREYVKVATTIGNAEGSPLADLFTKLQDALKGCP